ncbi:tRNA (guanosine(46)-N7)-methyltransferase TrmB [Actinotalea sp. K2]|uniref:tRNA (guanosine(46)-N7)-methyltransferase TrmB n=1 Tax=Actinotalea sp. K2 TaxID=2939438 RepID=UPI0020177AD5|nr:tRNA (guanosine(46)-N7)-methyltransferase TrmB [Actinotalea sp. K2]MCL3863189.1 tRNA (guanosine(46)-N7)-methyltransferase TrmB [Actinotalea sp. K2]
MTSPTDRFSHVPASAHDPIRTFHPRRSPLRRGQRKAVETLWDAYGFSVHDDTNGAPPLTPQGHLDTTTLFGRSAPVVLEIGSGMGEAVAATAAAHPEHDHLAVEAHVPGVASTLRRIRWLGLTNLRVAHGDALDLLRDQVTPGSLHAVHVFFPDPWPKARHHKRRIISPEHVALMRSRLAPGGTLHCATDWAPYAASMLETLEADPGLVNPHDGYAPRPADRPVTKFEQRGLDLGHPIHDLVMTRTTASVP